MFSTPHDTSSELHDYETVMAGERLLYGRQTEIRQLLKLVNQAKSGQAKSVLLTGDAGIGKSVLLEALMELACKTLYCRVIHLSANVLQSPDCFFLALLEQLQREANLILDEALLVINNLASSLDLHWEKPDLLRAASLLQFHSPLATDYRVRGQEQLFKSIKSQLAFTKKLKFSTNDTLKKLVDLIMNPWVIVSASLLTPSHPVLQPVCELESALRQNRLNAVARVTELENSPDKSLTLPFELSRSSGGEDFMEEKPEGEEVSQGKASFQPVLPIGSPLAQQMVTLVSFVNELIRPLDSALVIIVDEWDQIQKVQHPFALKQLFADWLNGLASQKADHVMILLSARTEGESYTLAGSLYNQFRVKLLLEPLKQQYCSSLLQAELCSVQVSLEDAVQHALFGLSRGNPFWLLKLSACLEERIQANAIQVVDADFLDKLGLDTVEGLLELMFTRLKLHFLTSENNLYKVIAALLKQFGHTAFTAVLAIREISFSQGVKERYVFDVFQALYRYDFLKRLNVKAPQQEPLYAVQSRFVSEFLQFKTALVETDLSTDHKLMYLKKVIPLSVRSGDLDREKTIEVLSLAKAIGNDSIVQFLTETFKEAYQQETRPVVRVNIVNSLALINAGETREILYQAMRDSSALVREYAARNMALLFDVNQEPEAVSWVVQCVEQAVGDGSESVRAEVYQVLYQYRFSADLTNLFLQGVSDVSSVVRLTALQGLSDSCHQSDLVLSVLLDAVQDLHADVRRYACIALQRLDSPEAIEAMSWLMQHDPEASIRSLAAELLHEVGGAEMMETMVSILETTAPEDVKISIVRSLGKQGGLQNELVFRGLLQSINADEMPALAWTVIRALSNSASTQATLDLLKGLSQHLGNSILQSAIQTALRSIQPRVPQPQVRPSSVSTKVFEDEDVDETLPSFSGEAIPAMSLSESSQPVEIPGSSEVSFPDQPEEPDNPLPVERPVLPDAVQTVEVLFSQENKPKKERFLEHEIAEGKASDLGDANLEPGIEGVIAQKEEGFLPHERDLAFIEEQLLASARVSNTQFFQEMETLRFAPPPARNAMSTTRKK